MFMNNREVLQAHGVLKQAEALKGKSENMVKFRYAIAKNITMIEAEAKALQKSTEPKPAYMAYDKERIDLCIKLANKDEAGKPIIKHNQYDLSDESGGLKPEFTKAHDELKAKCAEAITEREAQLAEYEKLLDEPSELKLYTFSMEFVPDDVSGTLMKSLMPFFTEEAPA